jgi:opacity protein-like surface antigen
MKKLLCLAILSLAALAPAWGQTFEVSPYYGWTRMSKTPLGSSSPAKPQSNDTTFRNGRSYGARLTLNTKGYYGHELSYTQTFATLQTKMQATTDDPKLTLKDKVILRQLSYNFLIYFMPRGERWRPFITGGAEGVYSPNPKIAGWTGRVTRNYGFNYGGGLKVKLFNHALLRLDVRDSRNGKPYELDFPELLNAGGWVRQIEGSVGIAIGF